MPPAGADRAETSHAATGATLKPHVLFAVLRELGVLFEAPGAADMAGAPGAAPAALPGDHAFHVHTPLWDYEPQRFARPFARADLPPIFETLPPGLAPAEVTAKTRFIVFLGAADTPTFRSFLARPDVFLLIIEPDAARLAAFAAKVPAAQLAKRSMILLGEPDDFDPPVSAILPQKRFTSGFPVFYALPGFGPGEAMARHVELIELLFFRHRLYRLIGQPNARGLPLRKLVCGLFYDQQLHSYANTTQYLRWPDIRPLRKAFAGETAVLVAAGPALPEQLDYLRSVRDKALVIAVNNALKPLVAAGITPHFVVANDTSELTAQSWSGLPPLPEVALVSHCLADLGGEVFGRKYLFGNYMPELFGNRANLRLHGSVLTTAFSLARHMGCVRCVLAGAQLCSPNPWSLSYSAGSIHEKSGGESADRPLTNAWPQLTPVVDFAGRTCYSTLNFMDAARWLCEEIRASGIACVTLTDRTILRGQGIRHIPNCPVEPTGRLARRLARTAAAPQPRLPREPVAAFLRSERAVWTTIVDVIQSILTRQGEDFVIAAIQVLEQFEQNNVSYLVQRFGNFENWRFHAAVFGEAASGRGPDEGPEWGLRYYLEHVAEMAGVFIGLLRQQAEELARLPD